MIQKTLLTMNLISRKTKNKRQEVLNETEKNSFKEMYRMSGNEK